MKTFLFRLTVALFFAWTPIGSAAPTLWIIGDSTVRNNTRGQQGWGDELGPHFDAERLHIANRAIGGRSSRTFLTEGRWDEILAELDPGDFVLIQFGHNDGGQMFEGDRPRASIKGTGEQTERGVVAETGVEETVHSYGWYLRKYAADALDRGATPIVLSPVPRNIWRGGQVARADDDYGRWARAAAAEVGAPFINLNGLVADAYETIGQEGVAEFFSESDHTHTNLEGAQFTARVLAEAVAERHDLTLRHYLAREGLWMPTVFSDHMVLQQEIAIPVWGRAEPGAAITVRLGGESVDARADVDGRWRARLPAMRHGGPYRLEVADDRGGMLEFDDVLIGEVWICSGQSNMDFTVAPSRKRYFAGTENWESVVAETDEPEIRTFSAEWTLRDEPAEDVPGTWFAATPEHVGDFSAVAYFFARDLHHRLGTPVGLLTVAYGASTAEAWISREKIAGHPQLEEMLERYDEKKRAYQSDPAQADGYAAAMAKWREAGGRGRAPKNPDPVQDQHHPTVLYNGMIHPLIPYGIRGAIWYQGESNVGSRDRYAALQETLIADWRERWGLGDFPFYFVQLAAYKAPAAEPGDSSLAAMREAQAEALTLPNTGMAVTIDIGEEEDIHPRNKQDVGHRLARLALAQTYKREDVVCRGPRLDQAVAKDGSIRLSFDHIADGLVAAGGEPRHFAIAGEDRKFRWAEARLDGGGVVLHHPEIDSPLHVRYAWADNPKAANLYNSESLPAEPFRVSVEE